MPAKLNGYCPVNQCTLKALSFLLIPPVSTLHHCCGHPDNICIYFLTKTKTNMKKIFIGIITLSAVVMACNEKKQEAKTESGSTLALPYKASYTTDFNTNVSDSALLLVLNSYKYWESGDLTALRSTMGDSMDVQGADGFQFHGLTDSLMPKWKVARDSMSSVVITMEVWLKNHALKDSMDYINVWYKEIDTYKNGKVDSANYEDDNAVKNGKIIWYSSHKQQLGKKTM